MFEPKPPIPMHRNANAAGWLATPFPFDPPGKKRRTRLPRLAGNWLDAAEAQAADPEGVPEPFLMDPYTGREVGT